MAGAALAEQATLQPINERTLGNFGSGVDISGDLIVVGSEGEGSCLNTVLNGPLCTYALCASLCGDAEYTCSSACRDTKCMAEPGTFVGVEPYNERSCAFAGAAYVFNRSSGAQVAYLKASNAGLRDMFGHAVSISGDTIVVGAWQEGSSQANITNNINITNSITGSADNNLYHAGAAYVFVRSGTSWAEQAYLKAASPTRMGNFGICVSISGDTIVVGSIRPGSVDVFVRSGTIWTRQSSLAAATQGQVYFGLAVSIWGDTIVVGSRKEDNFAGAAYVFVRSGTVWAQQARLKASNAEDFDRFGVAVSISGDTIAVGAVQEDSNQASVTNGNNAATDNSARDAGAAYVFVRSGTAWAQQAYLKASNAESAWVTGTRPLRPLSGGFGHSVSISGDNIVVGAELEAGSQTCISGNTSTNQFSARDAGAAYTFVRSGTTWAPQAYLKASDLGRRRAQSNSRRRTADKFGSSVVVSGDTIIAGSKGSSGYRGYTSGAAYVFAPSPSATYCTPPTAAPPPPPASTRRRRGSGSLLAGSPPASTTSLASRDQPIRIVVAACSVGVLMLAGSHA